MAQNESSLVFVVGVVRSGTSLLFSMLNQHSRLGLMYECDIWDFPTSLSPLRFRRRWLERQEFYNRVLSRHQLIFGRSLRGLEQVKKPEDLYRVFGEGKGATLWGEKSPFYGTRLRRLAKRFPNASFILLWRDPVEIYRSVEQAGRRSRFFRRRGMLSRLIFHQEEMIRQGAELNCKSSKVHHVHYHELVDNPERVSRGLCDFLKIPFEPAMLDLSNADFSSVGDGQLHDHLRRGVIERQSRKPVKMNPAVVEVLQRFEGRWERLKGQWFGFAHKPTTEPGVSELLYRRISGRFFFALDDCKRALFEFLPLTWLQSYRRVKHWYLAGRQVSSATPLRQELLQGYKKILASGLILFAVALLDFMTDPRVSVAPFYLIPTGILALSLSLRWATWSAVLCALSWSFMPSSKELHPDWSVLLWNSAMHFLVGQTVAVLLARARNERLSSLETPRAVTTSAKATATVAEPSNAQP